MANILLLHGPNLNLLGTREPDIYGHTDLASLDKEMVAQAKQLGHTLTHAQSNAEHELVAHIQEAVDNKIECILFNPAAFTHTSVALRDALLATQIPFIEIHLSNIHAREEFRQHSYFADIAIGTISGFGAQSYVLALAAAHTFLTSKK